MTATKPADSVVDYSIVIPVYFNEGALEGTMTSIKKDVIAHNPGLDCEVIFVDDGSEDGSLAELMGLHKQDPHTVKIIKLTRNFGQANALLAGFSYARGKCVIAMSADGQDPAGLINEMLKAHMEEGFEIVACARQGRDESYYRILTSKLFYAIMRKLSFPNMPVGGFDFVLLGRRALAALLRNQEAHPFFQGQLLWTGFKIKFIDYRRQERRVGQSRWTFGKKLTYLLDGMMSYSFLPLRFMSAVGILAALFGFLYALVVIINRLVSGSPVQGFAPLMVVILVMGGLQMLMLGIVGEYLWRTLAQVRSRDPYIIETVFDASVRTASPDSSSLHSVENREH
jgi:glycosyltransferase involved in cell wall biosynthesis